MSEQDKPVAWMAMRFGNSPANVTLSHAEAVGWHASGGDVRALVFAAPPAPPAPELPELPEPWRATVDDMLTVCHMTASDDPRESVNRLINWHVSVALDPCVSSDAQALIDQGAALAADRAARVPVPDELRELEQAEAHYRLTFQIAPHAGHLDVGRAWDRMKKAGDKARAVLAAAQGSKP